jgi:tetratricopeptide (TPR) repeat protein
VTGQICKLALSAAAAGLMILSGLSAGAAETTTSASAPSETRRNMRELWNANVGAISDHADPNVRQAIRDLRAMDLSPHAKPPVLAMNDPTASIPTTASAPTSQSAGETLPAAPPPVLSPAALAQLKKQAAVKGDECLAVADALFQSGHLETAGEIYQALLKDQADPQRKAWALVQLGNCRRPQDPAAARAAYAQLLSECPDSQWAPVAKSQIGWIDWMESANPRAALAATDGGAGPAGMVKRP